MKETRETQSIIVKDEEWGEILNDVEEVMDVAITTKSADYALNYGYSIVREGRIKGVKLAALLYQIKTNWSKFDTDDYVEDAVEKAGICPKDTFKKYTGMYEHVLIDHPELAGKPVEGLIKLTAAAREGQLEDADWEEVRLAHDNAAIISIRDRVRGIQTSGHSRLSIWRSREGNLYCKRGSKGDIKSCGFLPPETGDADIDAAVERMMSVGVLDQ